jgi:signal transduction histidine kinase
MYFSERIESIIGCLGTEHDPRLVVLAALICLFSCFTASGLIQRTGEATSDRAWPWLAAAVGVFSCGVWATHFIAELAYAPGLPVGFGVRWTALSLVIAAAITTVGARVALRINAAAGGAIIGAAIGAMHFSGMQALQVPADIGWDIPLAAASVVWAIAVGALALWVLLRKPTLQGQLYGTVLFVIAICGLHFAAMAALRLEPNPLLPVPAPWTFDHWLAGSVATVTAAIIVAAQVAVHIDMRLAKTALAKSYSRLAGALETLPAGIALFDQSDRLVVFNATYARIHSTIADILVPGITFETILRQNVRRSRFELGEEEQESYIARRLAQHRNPSDAFERGLVDGRWERVHEQRMADGGLSLVITDITRDKEREAALLMAKDVADAANSAKSSFLANMSHELRTPLNAIVGFSEAMTLAVFGPIGSPRYVEYAKDIHKSGRYLHELITDMLDVAKIEAGHQQLEREPIDCSRAIEDVLAMVRPRAETGAVTIELHQTNTFGALLADRRAFKQILANVISNAVKFTPAGGLVTVRVSSSGRDGLLEVSDTGIGIAESDLENLGTPFFRSNHDLSANTEGTGLGLLLTRSLVNLHGWQLDITSEPGCGTTVTISMLDSVTPTETPSLPRAAVSQYV